MSDIVQFTEEESYCLIQLDDGKANVVGFALLEQLNAALDKAVEAGKVVIIAGRPGKFSAGFDLPVMQQGGEAATRLIAGGAELARRLQTFPTPVVLAVTGHALAMGGLILLSADYRIGIAGDYKLGLNEVAIGLSMPRFGIAIARARLTKAHFQLAVNCARLYDAEGAVEAGFLDEAVDVDQLMSRAVAVAEEFSKLDMVAHKTTKYRVRAELFEELEGAIEWDFSEGGGV